LASAYHRSSRGQGCPFCGNYSVLAGYNDLATTHPQLATEALFDPEKVIAGSNKKLPWRCAEGHQWSAVVVSRTAGSGCPVCANHSVLPGFNDLATTHPQLATEAMFDALTVGSGSNKKMPWRCASGHEWEATVVNRAQGRGCPVCTNKLVLRGYNDLATTHPQLATDAMFDASTVVAGSNKKLPWKCAKGHEWATSVAHRTVRAQGCPVCANQVVVLGYNDLASTNPQLAAEALFDPTKVIAGSNKKLPWRCAKGHEWVASVVNRTRGRGCPFCTNFSVLPGYNDLATTNPQLATEALFDASRVTAGSSKKLPWKCAKGHEWSAVVVSRSSQGTGCPYCANLAVLRGFNDLETTHPQLVSEALFDATTVNAGSGRKLPWKCVSGHEWLATVAARAQQGHGCHVCTNQSVLVGFNDLATVRPDLATEALFDATTVMEFSGKKLPWRCAEGHEWNASVSSRTSMNTGCPTCANKSVLTGYNDLATTHPQLILEALFDPTKVIAGSNRKLPWKCAIGHEWTATGATRIKGSGCPFCTNYFVFTGFNDLATTHPHLATEALFDATKIMAGTGKKLLWKCPKGHEWKATPNSRSSNGTGCPYCANFLVLSGFNDLATTNPQLASEALFDATTVTAGSDKKLPWRCPVGHEWTATVGHRAKGSGCHYCSGRAVLVGFNDLATVRPDLAAEALFDATTVVEFSGKKLPWRCAEGHEWSAVVANRTNVGSGCPSCAVTGFKPDEQGWIYLVVHPEWEVTQVGITNVPKNRLRDHTSQGWELRDLRGPMDGSLAKQWESDILRYIKSQSVSLSPMGEGGKFSGYTEAWWTKDFEVEKLQALMDNIDALETGV